MSSSGKILYSRKEAAQALSLSVRSIDHLIARDALQPTKLGSRVLVHEKELLRFAASTRNLGRIKK
jgi:excisionase family DNA binding protein